MPDLEGVLKFACASLGLLGIHLYEPYLSLIIDLNTVQSELLILFPQLYEEIMHPHLHGNFCQIDTSAFKSLDIAWKSPFTSESPYDVDVIHSLQEYIKEADTNLIQLHIDEALKVLAAGFADQKGSAYGFGPTGNSEAPTLLAELSIEKLDKFHTNSKSIENAFGHLDNLLKQSGPQGFDKAIQAMQIASAKDLVFDRKHSWRKMPVQKRQQMKEIQMNWNQEQQKLLDNGVKASDVNALLRAQMMSKHIESLKKHGGPLNSNLEIDRFPEKYSNKPEKDLAKMLNKEIRFRRDSNLRYSVSKDCYLYREHGITDVRSTATVEDLRRIIVKPTANRESVLPQMDPQSKDKHSSEEPAETRGTTDQNSDSVNEFISNGPWPPKHGEQLAIYFEDGLKIGEVVELSMNEDNPNLDEVIEMRVYKKYELDIHNNLSLWQDVDCETLIVRTTSVMPVRPQIEVVPSLSRMTRS